MFLDDQILWGMIGCGDVTEVKSGPAFSKVPQSTLSAVMCRTPEKAAAYAAKHQVPKWYSDADQLISDPEVNAIYIATPPSSHKELTLKALAAGKPVYVEKPMSLNTAEAKEMADAAKYSKLCVAHYRREQPKFKKIKELLDEKFIGDVSSVDLKFFRRSLTEEELAVPKIAWRVNKKIAGGGLFHDIAPHQLDLLLYFFGDAKTASGKDFNESKQYDAPDRVEGSIVFKNEITFSGEWNFSVSPENEKDEMTISGKKGEIVFSVFGENIIAVTIGNEKEIFEFEMLQHVQQPMIHAVTEYFLGKRNNPCSGEDGVKVMEWMDAITGPQI